MSFLQGLAPSRFGFTRKRYRPDLASQWQLMWWKFRRHKMAMVGMALLGLFLAMTLFAETISPYPARPTATRTMSPARRCCRAWSTRPAHSTCVRSSMARSRCATWSRCA